MHPIGIPAFQDNYIWLFTDEYNKSAICVDPGDAIPVLTHLKNTQLTLSCILLTHHHADHSAGIATLREAFPEVCVYGPIDNRLASIYPIISNQNTIHTHDYCFHVLKTPGHTSSHICYFEPNRHWLFCGDTLFSGGCGRVFDGTMEALYASLQTLKKLPDDTQVFCGHEYTYNNLQFALSTEPNNPATHAHLSVLKTLQNGCSLPSTIALEKNINPFLRANSFPLFKHLREKKDLF